MRLPITQRVVSTGLVWNPAGAKGKTNTSGSFQIQAFIPYQLVVLAGYVGNELLRAYKQFGISVPEWRVITTTAASPGITAIELTTRVQLDEIAVHRAVTSLIKRGLLCRASDTVDRRRKPLELTASGRATYRAVIPLAREFEQWMLAKLPRNEQKDFVMILRKLCELLKLIS